jgi:hypothetical protein
MDLFGYFHIEFPVRYYVRSVCLIRRQQIMAIKHIAASINRKYNASMVSSSIYMLIKL